MNIKLLTVILSIWLFILLFGCHYPKEHLNAEYWFKRGNAEYNKGYFSRAISEWSKAIKLNPQYAIAYYNRGMARYAIKEEDRAFDDFQKSYKLESYLRFKKFFSIIEQQFDAGDWYVRGLEKFNKNDYDQAISYWTKALELNPKYIEVYFERGFVWYNKGNYEQTIKDFSKYLELKPKDDNILFGRGIAWAKNNNPKEAIVDWKKAIEINIRKVCDIYYCRKLVETETDEFDQIVLHAAICCLDKLGGITGSAVGDMGEQGEFYTISNIIMNHLKEDEFIRMTKNTKPIIRAMGIVCLAKSDIKKYKSFIQSLYNDTEEVGFLPHGCVISRISIGNFAKNIIEDSKFIEYWIFK